MHCVGHLSGDIWQVEHVCCAGRHDRSRQGEDLQVEADVLALLVVRHSPRQRVQLVNGQCTVIHLHQSCLHMPHTHDVQGGLHIIMQLAYAQQQIVPSLEKAEEHTLLHQGKPNVVVTRCS